MATNNFVAGPGVTGASDFQTTASMLERKQKMLDAMLAQAGPGAGRMVGGSFAAPTGLEHLVSAITPFVAKHKQEGLDAERASNAMKYQQGMQTEMGQYGAAGTPTREAALRMLVSQFPEIRARGQTEIGKYDAQDTPFARMLAGMGGSSGAPGGMPQGNGPVGGVQTMGVPDPSAEFSNPPPAVPSGVQSKSGSDRIQQMFPNLSPQEIQGLMAMDPSGKQLMEANLKRNAPIVAGNNVYQPQGGGRIGNAPGSVEAMAAAIAAQERAKAPYGTPVEVETENGIVKMRPDQFQGAAGGQPGGQPSATGFQLPTTANATNFRIPPAVQAARDGDRGAILRAELAKETDPNNRAMIERELSRLPGGAPAAPQSGFPGVNSGYGPTQKAERTGLFDSDVKQVGEYRAAAQKAGQAMRAINQIETGLKGGSFQGTYANVQERAAAFFGPLGIPVDANKLTNTQEVKAFVQNLVIPQVKQLGFNPTDADARRIEESVGNIATDPRAMEKIMGVLKADSKQTIDMFKKADAHLRKNRSLEGFDYGFENATPSQPAAAAPGKTVTLEDYLKGKR